MYCVFVPIVVNIIVQNCIMEKSKLLKLREIKGFSQQDVANHLATDVTNYSRKENHAVKISQTEWTKLASFLKCEIEDIYEPHEQPANIVAETFNGNSGNFYTYNNNMSELQVEVMKKYIKKLEDENDDLKKRLGL